MTDPEGRLQPGDIVERYEVLSVLGQGGMATVLEVRHRDLGTRHALKVLQIAFPGLHDRLLQEGRIQAGLIHPNVCRVSDVVRVGGVPGLVMELVEGPTLDTLIANYQPNLPQIDSLARDIVCGVRAAHKAGLVHRDLKPANVLVAAAEGRVLAKVADFGLAKAVDDSIESRGGANTRSGATLGTPMYMAPEQFRNAKRADHRADLFSLGCILYELVSGVPAFTGESPVEVFQLTSAGVFRPLRDVAPAAPERIERAITRALSPDPTARWKSCDEMLDAWNDGIGDLEIPGVWEESHLQLLRSLGPTARPKTSTLSFPQGELPRTRTEARVGPTAVPTADRRSLFRAAVGLIGLGSVVGIGIVALGAAVLAGILWSPTPSTPPLAPAAVIAPAPEVPDPVPDPVSDPAPPDPEPPRAVISDPEPPRPVAPEEVAPPIPPAPAEEVRQPAPDPTLARIEVEGIRRAWLETPSGQRYKPGSLPAGRYALQAFFDEIRPTRAMTLDLRPGEARVIHCQPSLKVCK